MAKCETCGNDYDKCMEIRLNDEIHVYDCFECAIHDLAPSCHHCGCKIIGHGVESRNAYYCCTSCAVEMGAPIMQHRS